MSTKNVNEMIESMKYERLSRCLYLDRSKESAQYLKEAYKSCYSYMNKGKKKLDTSTNLKNLVKDIIKLSNTAHQTINPNNSDVYRMISEGKTLYEIWYTLREQGLYNVSYIPTNVEKELLPILSIPDRKRKLEYYKYLNFINQPNNSTYSFQAYMTNIWIDPDAYRYLLGFIVDLVSYHDSSMLGMIDIFSDGIITTTLRNIDAYIKDVISGYCWCFIHDVDSSGLYKLFIRYRNGIIPLMKKSICTIMYYSDIDNIPDNIDGKMLRSYVDNYNLEEGRLSTYEYRISYAQHTIDGTGDYPVVYCEERMPSLVHTLYPLTQDESLYTGLKSIFDFKKELRYSALNDLYGKIIRLQDHKVHEGKSNLRLRLCNAYTNISSDTIPFKMLGKPWLKLTTEIVKKAYNDVEAEEQNDSSDETNAVSEYPGAVQRSPKYPINRLPMRPEVTVAFYDAHSVDIPKSVMRDRHITRRTEFDEDFYVHHKSVYPTMNARELADITDRTLGFEEYDLYNKHPGGDIDRSSWEPRRNNWTLTH